MAFRTLSPEGEELIKVSREIALQLKYDYISTLHFFIADCTLNKTGSIKNFSFETEDQFQDFIGGCKSPNPVDFNVEENVPLTREAEKALRSSALQAYVYGQRTISTCHILIAALENKKSILSLIFAEAPNTKKDLINYYSNQGLIDVKKSKEFPYNLLLQFPFRYINSVRFKYGGESNNS